MTDPILHLRIIGVSMIALALVHIDFPRRFGWKTELAPLSLISRQLMQVHTFFIALVVLMVGVLCAFSAQELASPTPLAKTIAGGLAIFWAIRWVCQFFVYSPALWRGKPFETTMHVFFGLTWTYYVGVFAWVWWS